MQFACLVDTPLQALNVLNFVYHDMEGAKKNADLYFWENCTAANRICEELDKLKIFRSVSKVKLYSQSDRPWISLPVSLLRHVAPRHDLMRHGVSKEAFNQQYDAIVFSCFNHFVFDFILAYPKAQLYLIEDGAGSYSSNVIERTTGYWMKKFSRFTQRNLTKLKAEKLYLNNLAFMQPVARQQAKEICGLPSLKQDKEFLEIAAKVFNGKQGEGDEKEKWFLLPSPSQDILNFSALSRKCYKKVLEKLPLQTVVRLHPRDKRLDVFENREVSLPEQNWELECVLHLTDAHVLIGECSTAQIMPKLLAGKEPWLIYLYPLFAENYEKKEYESMENMYQTIRTAYTDQSKIFLVTSIEELEHAIQYIEATNS